MDSRFRGNDRLAVAAWVGVFYCNARLILGSFVFIKGNEFSVKPGVAGYLQVVISAIYLISVIIGQPQGQGMRSRGLISGC